MKRLLALLMALLLMAPAVMAESAPYYIDGKDADRVHLRKGPSTGEDSLGLYYTGTDVILIDIVGEWTKVLVGSETGYIMTKYLTETQIARRGPWQMVDNPSSTWVNLRISPSMDASITLCPDNGTSVRVLGETADGWSYVECKGITGYMRTGMLSALEKRAIDQRTTILSQACSDGYIHQYVAPNGQALYFTAELEEPRFYLDDVNFDGWDDIVVMTISGATNAWYTFFTYDNVRDVYTHVPHYGAELINYTTYPQYGIIASYGKNGYAGLLHVTSLYRWEGNRLKQIRSSVSDEWTETRSVGQIYTQKIHGDTLHVRVFDHSVGNDGTVIYERFIPMDELRDSEDYQRIYDEEMDALWQGLK